MITDLCLIGHPKTYERRDDDKKTAQKGQKPMKEGNAKGMRKVKAKNSEMARVRETRGANKGWKQRER